MKKVVITVAFAAMSVWGFAAHSETIDWVDQGEYLQHGGNWGYKAHWRCEARNAANNRVFHSTASERNRAMQRAVRECQNHVGFNGGCHIQWCRFEVHKKHGGWDDWGWDD